MKSTKIFTIIIFIFFNIVGFSQKSKVLEVDSVYYVNIIDTLNVDYIVYADSINGSLLKRKTTRIFQVKKQVLHTNLKFSKGKEEINMGFLDKNGNMVDLIAYGINQKIFFPYSHGSEENMLFKYEPFQSAP